MNLSEKDVTNTFSYLYALFDPNGRFETESLTNKSSEVQKVAKYIEFLRKENSYDKIELKTVFEFMKTIPF